ncbi:CBF/Mak21 family-domain-containing protein [Suillus subaureus]|uniref:CBF/Mak21 family-domain-containing protein n=1 Tax=Suillus subaureus TaxID=48587 RepID=A0A9P7JIR9_9AGAM|nr:CBF/Mak21 family-domain-containing protein [Suillus subaureus]KAG1824519.1 CBF/Mak21 family-domain-containing protein [Suillus subaureus]
MPTPARVDVSKVAKKPQIEASPLWYQNVPNLSGSSTALPPVTSAKLSSLMERGASLHAKAVETYQSGSSSTATSSSSDYAFLQKILHSGTLSDRLSALTLLVQSSPLHNTKALETLKGMAERGKGKGGREESLKALRCILDWWVGGGAPNRKLKYFRDQPLSHQSVKDDYILIWYFEDWLKKYFFSILQILEVLSMDPLAYVRTQALSLTYTLLRDKPEQEHNLLRLLVNKLGDSEKSICSRASYHLLQLLQAHPSMKGVVVREMTIATPATAPTTNTHIRFTDETTTSTSKPKPKPKPKPDGATKRTSNDHARYYATITLNQIVFVLGDKDVAVQVIDVYFQMFKDLLGESRSSGKKEIAEEQDGEVVGKKKKRKTTKEVVGDGGFTEVEDAFSKSISAILTGVNRALPYAKLGPSDVNLNKHIDTLFLITHTSTFNTSLQALLLIQQISSSLSHLPESSSSALSKSIVDRYYRTLYQSLHDGRLASSSKQTMYLNLLFKSLKADDNPERVKSFVRRGSAGGTEFIVGGLYLLGELFSTVPGLRDLSRGSRSTSEEQYDPRKRDPQFAHPSASPLFELIPLVHHYHPTVSLHAQQLLSGQPITSSPDLSLNTLSHFLDRFVYKNPKKIKAKGSSAMQPAASANDRISVKLLKGESSGGALPNDKKFLNRRLQDIPVDEVFFHKYFSRKREKDKNKTAHAGKGDSDAGESDDASDIDASASELEEAQDRDVDDVKRDDDSEDDEDSDAEEADIWKAMQASMPRMAGDEDLMADSDSVVSDLDDSDGDDEEVEVDEENEDEDGGSGDDFSMVEASDNEDLLGLDEVPQGLIESDRIADEDGGDGEEQWNGFGSTKKRKQENESKREKRKKLRSLPTFASYEDYAKMIEDGPEDDI